MTAPDDLSRTYPGSDSVRIVARTSLRYLMATLGTMVEESQTDAIDVLLLVSITGLNVAHLRDQPELNNRYAAVGAPVPMEARRPVPLEEAAGLLKLPIEDARRRIDGLVAAGYLAEDEAGLIGRFEEKDPEGFVRLTRTILALSRQFVRDLERQGVTFDEP